MVVPVHSLVAPLWSNGRSMVIRSPLKGRFMCSVHVSFFLGSVHDMYVFLLHLDKNSIEMKCEYNTTSF